MAIVNLPDCIVFTCEGVRVNPLCIRKQGLGTRPELCAVAGETIIEFPELFTV